VPLDVGAGREWCPGKLEAQHERRVAFRLCLALGYLHPDDLLEDLTAQQWAEWLEFYALEPWGFPVNDMRHGMLCAAVLAPHMKKGDTAEPRNFMLRPPPEREPTPGETEAHLDALFGVRTPKKE
jgi:hypothetical protein